MKAGIVPVALLLAVALTAATGETHKRSHKKSSTTTSHMSTTTRSHKQAMKPKASDAEPAADAAGAPAQAGNAAASGAAFAPEDAAAAASPPASDTPPPPTDKPAEAQSDQVSPPAAAPSSEPAEVPKADQGSAPAISPGAPATTPAVPAPAGNADTTAPAPATPSIIAGELPAASLEDMGVAAPLGNNVRRQSSDLPPPPTSRWPSLPHLEYQSGYKPRPIWYERAKALDGKGGCAFKPDAKGIVRLDVPFVVLFSSSGAIIAAHASAPDCQGLADMVETFAMDLGQNQIVPARGAPPLWRFGRFLVGWEP